MATETVQAIVESHPDLLYIEITAWATVALVFATLGMIFWQVKATKSVAKVELSMRLMEQYDSVHRALRSWEGCEQCIPDFEND